MIDSTYFLTNTLLMIVGTIMIRGSFIAFSHKMNLSQNVRDLFTYIPAAVLPAIFVPATFFHAGKIEWLLHHERFIILGVCLVATYFVRNTLFCIALGLGLLYLVQGFAF